MSRFVSCRYRLLHATGKNPSLYMHIQYTLSTRKNHHVRLDAPLLPILPTTDLALEHLQKFLASFDNLLKIKRTHAYPNSSILLCISTYNNSTYYLKLYNAPEQYFSAIIKKHYHYCDSCMICDGKSRHRNNFVICSHIVALKGPQSITTQFYLSPKCPSAFLTHSSSHTAAMQTGISACCGWKGL